MRHNKEDRVPDCGQVMCDAPTVNLREKFVERFGEDEASRIEASAQEHMKSNDVFKSLASLVAGGEAPSQADDSFLLAISWCISWECLWVDAYRRHHGFTHNKEEVRSWIRENVIIPEGIRDPASSDKYEEYLG